MPRFLRIVTAVVISALALLILAMLLQREPVSSGGEIALARQEAIEEAVCPDVSYVAERIHVAESSRRQVIQDSIDESISVEESIQESIAESIYIAESIAESIQASEEAQRLAEERARLESIAAASRAAAVAAAAANLPPVSGNVILFGDSRTSGFSAYNCYPASAVLWSWNQFDPSRTGAGSQYGNIQRAAAAAPEKIVFLNGVDDLLVYGVAGSRNYYEQAIQYFHSLSPNTKIYVGSVLPCEMGRPATANRPVLAEIPTYNLLLQDMCARNGWTYVDGSDGFSNAFAFGTGEGRDGIHFTPAWTRQWLNNLRLKCGF